MKKLILSFLVSFAAIGFAAAQTDLEPTQLGKWTRPANTDVAAVDNYVAAAAAFYQEAMDIRAQYEAIGAADVSIESAAAEAIGSSDALKEKKAEYEALLERIKAQSGPAAKLVELAAAAVQATPKGLKALQTTKNIAATKDAVKLATEENAAVLKAVTQQLTTLSAAPVVNE